MVSVRLPQSSLYYEWEPRSYLEPIICFCSLVGSLDVFFHQMASLAPRGCRIPSVLLPPYWSIYEFCGAHYGFLYMFSLNHVLVYSAELGFFSVYTMLRASRTLL